MISLLSFYIFIILSTAVTAGILYLNVLILKNKFYISYKYIPIICCFMLFLAFKTLSLNILFYLKEIISFDLQAFLIFHSISQDIIFSFIVFLPVIIESIQKPSLIKRITFFLFPGLLVLVKLSAYFLLLPVELFNYIDSAALILVFIYLFKLLIFKNNLTAIAVLSLTMLFISVSGYILGETGLMLQRQQVKIFLVVFFILNILDTFIILNFFPRRIIDEVDISLLEECCITPREKELIIWAVRGYTNREIADKLSLSEKTVKNHFTSIYDKIGVKNRIDLFRLTVKA